MHDTSGCVAANISPAALFAAVLTLALGGFFLGSGEFASMSLLPALAGATAVSVPVAGGYISAYAAGVVVGAPLIAVVGAAWPRRQLLLSLMALVVVGYVASALAWSYPSLLAARFISGLPHGAWYGVAGLAAAQMVPQSKRTRYIGYVMVGLAAANVAGVPAMTWLGQHFGWRSAFCFVAGGAFLTMLLLRLYVPETPGNPDASPLTEIRALGNAQVWITLAVASVGFGGMFAVYSYITPTLTEVSGFRLSQVPGVLVVWGLGMIVGNIVGGRMADRGLIASIFLMLLWNVACLVLFARLAEFRSAVLVVLFLLGTGFALVPTLQARLMDVAREGQTLAASLNHSAFNLANAIGATLGGLSISLGYGWASTGWVGAGLAVGGVLLMILSVALARR